jgi:hypothetical protein
VADRILKLDYGKLTGDEYSREFTFRPEVAVQA